MAQQQISDKNLFYFSILLVVDLELSLVVASISSASARLRLGLGLGLGLERHLAGRNLEELSEVLVLKLAQQSSFVLLLRFRLPVRAGRERERERIVATSCAVCLMKPSLECLAGDNNYPSRSIEYRAQ